MVTFAYFAKMIKIPIILVIAGVVITLADIVTMRILKNV
jgi:hypothetical protein